MKKKKIILASILSTVAAGSALFALGGTRKGLLNASTCSHEGNHYAENPATTLESGYDEFYVCCKCHEVFKQDVQPDGNWTDATVKADIKKGHAAYTEPTVTKADVEEKLAALETTVAIDTIPSVIDKHKYEQALTYKDTYMAKDDSVPETELVGIDNLYGAANVLNYNKEVKFEQKINEYNVKPRKSLPFTFNQVDNEIGFEYTKYEITEELSGWDFLYYYQGGILKNLPDGPIEVYVRSNTSIKICSRTFDGTNDLYGTATTLVKNQWTPIIFTAEQVAVIKGLVNAANNNNYYGNGVRIQISQASIPVDTVVDFTTFYAVDDLDLPSYNVISSEKYDNWWNLAPLTGTLTTNLHNNNWFAGVKAPDNHPSYRDYFLETKYSNTTGNVLVANEDYRYNGTDNLACIFFRNSVAVVKTFTEVIYMVYSNEQVEINSTKLGLLNKWDSASVIAEKTLYKGWNALHLDVSKISATDGLYTFTMMPKKWSTTLQITTTAMFYKAAE